MQDPRFQPNSCKTYEPVKCNMNCNCDKDAVQCTYERRYAEMSSSSGVLGEDVISFGSESELVPPWILHSKSSEVFIYSIFKFIYPLY